MIEEILVRRVGPNWITNFRGKHITAESLMDLTEKVEEAKREFVREGVSERDAALPERGAAGGQG